jgi:cytochrome c
MLSASMTHAAGDVTAGNDLFIARCSSCHDLHPTRKPGPLLSGVYGRRAGSVAGYHYSTALKNASIIWNGNTLDRWLSDPPAYIPGVNMQAQVDSARDRQNIIAYLRSIGSATAADSSGTASSVAK